MWERIREIIRKEFRQTLRDPRRRVLLFGPPLVQLIVFGYAVNLDVENAAIGWMDQENTVESRELRAAFEGSIHFKVKHNLSSEAEIQNLLDHGKVQMVVRVMPGFARNILRGNTAAVQLLVDGTNSNTAAIIFNYANQVVASFSRKTLDRAQNMRRMAGAPEGGGLVQPAIGSVTAQSRIWFNPDLNSGDYFVPGVVVNIIALVTIMLTAMSIVREKEIGTMEQLMVTPIRPIELMLGKILPFAVIGIIEVAFVTTAALLIFHIPFRGSVLMLLSASILFLLTGLGIGLFISTISDTQQQAMMSSFFFFMPAMLLSGFSFPIRNMPLPVQFLTFLNPLRYFMEIVRGVFLKGTGLEFLWPQLAALLVFGAAILGLSALRFHKRLD
jgi:ABC-2 type transport system permease protein